ncbi:mismatch repair endonuclease PMS2 [Galendromus occidentalis]|uniref:Mismatch repair endonuclease PMS2 n=1 Tax=Galendromus occidentalis TaxID=34638 RepID=A0AAJ6VWW3_9ACAR|nr:mismatch repair endonuclease PMS2 [Galendromus occidentalis]
MAEESKVRDAESGDKIGKLDSWSVHRICSGQVIVCLAVAVKELVENALDAGAKEIVIRTKEFGSKLIEVQDNGDGIREENFDALCRKHFTSKLQNFAELENILTFGFRGEALSSLCALGELSVTTKHESKEVGHALKFDAEGLLSEKKPCARSTGTTVTVENIFVSLPVRHKQFLNNLKKEFTKMVHFMSGYCLIARDVAISLTNIDERGKRHDVLKKRAHSSFKDNIIEIFGFKEASRLLPYAQITISEEIKQEFGLGNVSTEHFDEVTVEGFVSSSEHGSGRSSADRQFIFVNSRPCDFPKLTRVINGVYHQFNSSQYPFVMLNIMTPRHLVDVNLTPDKRMLMLQRENVILAMVKASLTLMFQKQATRYAVSSVSKISSSFSRRESTPLELDGDSPDEIVEETRSRHAAALEKKQNYSSRRRYRRSRHSRESKLSVEQASTASHPLVGALKEGEDVERSTGARIDNEELDLVIFSDEDSSDPCELPANVRHSPKTGVTPALESSPSLNEDPKTSSGTGRLSDSPKCPGTSHEVSATEAADGIEKSDQDIPASSGGQEDDEAADEPGTVLFVDETPKRRVGTHFLDWSEEEMFRDFADLEEDHRIDTNDDAGASNANRKMFRFRARISPRENSTAESELMREITKDMFKDMDIIGQFNKGFIIAKLNTDLFIVDQHAADEKFNFETLQATTVIESQPLAIPLKLFLAPGNEQVVLENLPIFEKNGFRLSCDEDALCGRKLSLTAVPQSGQWAMGASDIDELIFMLNENYHPNRMNCRPSKVRAMFAMRACRKSVMVGHELRPRDMKRVVSQLSGLQHPWNCPHGRPTMRHLVNLNLVHL